MNLIIDGSDWSTSGEYLPADALADWVACGDAGDASDAVDAFLESHTVTCPDAARYLKPYGAWEADELLDHDTNVRRIVWLVGCDLRESGEAHLCTY